jgi:hypothetical protein
MGTRLRRFRRTSAETPPDPIGGRAEDDQPSGTSKTCFAAAFPTALADDVRIAQAAMPPGPYPRLSPFTVSVAGEAVAIPSRINNPEPTQARLAALTLRQQIIVSCLYTRHCDGYVRQRHVERVIRTPEPWIVPFVVQLVGEYVLEILVAIEHGLSEADAADSAFRALYGGFLAANPDFFARTERRVVSYWNCYHRHDHPDFARYPGAHLLNVLRSMAEQHSGLPAIA